MTFGRQIRVAGAVVIIASFFIHSMVLNLVGLCFMAIGVVMQVDNLESRIEALEPKVEETDEEN